MHYRTILFDIDGVMLSEERYFDASALTVHELLYSPQYLSVAVSGVPEFQPAYSEPHIRAIRRAVFAEDRVLRAMKQVGVNANWDMVYLQTAFQLTRILARLLEHSETGFQQRLLQAVQEGWTRQALDLVRDELANSNVRVQIDFDAYLESASKAATKAELFEDLENRLQTLLGPEVTAFGYERALWNVCQETFQEWYLGDSYVGHTHQPGKKGFLSDEIAIVQPQEFANLLGACKKQNVVLGIATGRPEIETKVPLKELGWLKFFDDARVSTASDVLLAERAHPKAAPLAKPNPFSYLRSYLAAKDPVEVLNHPLPLPQEDARTTLIVGDSVADRLAAQAMGCDFAAVLTGLEGEKARAQFEELGCDYIWSDVKELWTLLNGAESPVSKV